MDAREHVLECVRWSTITEGALSERELERASRFVQEQDRARFIAGRTLLRRTLGRELGVEPHAVDLLEGEHGKPYVLVTSLEFNLSHAGEWIALAFVHHEPIGVDVEHLETVLDLQLTARRVFTARELELLASERDEMSYRQRFFTFWTMKEAAMKTWGTGLSIDPLEVELDQPEESGAFFACHASHPVVSLRGFTCDSRHIGFVGRLTKQT